MARLTPGSPARFTLTVKMSARYICSGSSVFSPSLNGGMGWLAHDDHIRRFEGTLVVATEQRMHLLRLEVERVVVSRAQHARAEHDPPLHLGAESFIPGPVYIVVSVSSLALGERWPYSRRRSAPGWSLASAVQIR